MNYTYITFLELNKNLADIQAKLNDMRDLDSKDQGEQNALYDAFVLKKKELEQYANDYPERHAAFLKLGRIPEQLWWIAADPDFDLHLDEIVHKNDVDFKNKTPLYVLLLMMLSWPDKTASDYAAILEKNKLDPSYHVMLYVGSGLNRIDILNAIKNTKTPFSLERMIIDKYDRTFSIACESAHIEAMEWIYNQVPPEVQTRFIHEYYFEACNRRNLQTITWFNAQLTPVTTAEKSAVIIKNVALIFQEAAQKNDLFTMKWFAKYVLSQDMLVNIITNNHQIFHKASSYGYTNMMDWLALHLTPNQKMEMMASNNYQVFFNALTNSAEADGHTLNWLKKHATSDHWAAVRKEKYARAFLCTDQTEFDTDHDAKLQIMQNVWQEQETPEQKAALLETHDYEAFRTACKDNHPETIQWLFAQASEKQKKVMIERNEYEAFRIFLYADQATMIEWMIKVATPSQKAAMLAEYDTFHGSRSAKIDDIMHKTMVKKEICDWLTRKIYRYADHYQDDMKILEDEASSAQKKEKSLKSILNSLKFAEESQKRIHRILLNKYGKAFTPELAAFVNSCFVKKTNGYYYLNVEQVLGLFDIFTFQKPLQLDSDNDTTSPIESPHVTSPLSIHGKFAFVDKPTEPTAAHEKPYQLKK